MATIISDFKTLDINKDTKLVKTVDSDFDYVFETVIDGNVSAIGVTIEQLKEIRLMIDQAGDPRLDGEEEYDTLRVYPLSTNKYTEVHFDGVTGQYTMETTTQRKTGGQEKIQYIMDRDEMLEAYKALAECVNEEPKKLPSYVIFDNRFTIEENSKAVTLGTKPTSITMSKESLNHLIQALVDKYPSKIDLVITDDAHITRDGSLYNLQTFDGFGDPYHIFTASKRALLTLKELISATFDKDASQRQIKLNASTKLEYNCPLYSLKTDVGDNLIVEETMTQASFDVLCKLVDRHRQYTPMIFLSLGATITSISSEWYEIKSGNRTYLLSVTSAPIMRSLLNEVLDNNNTNIVVNAYSTIERDKSDGLWKISTEKAYGKLRYELTDTSVRYLYAILMSRLNGTQVHDLATKTTMHVNSGSIVEFQRDVGICRLKTEHDGTPFLYTIPNANLLFELLACEYGTTQVASSTISQGIRELCSTAWDVSLFKIGSQEYVPETKGEKVK